MQKQQEEHITIFDLCKDLNGNLSPYLMGIEELRIRILERNISNKLEKELIRYLDEHFKSVLADFLILKDLLFEVEQCNYDYSELSYLLELIHDAENIN